MSVLQQFDTRVVMVSPAGHAVVDTQVFTTCECAAASLWDDLMAESGRTI